jgi:predicted amino acid dehydrogenase
MKKYTYSYDRSRALAPLKSLEDNPKELIIDDLVRTREYINSIFDEFEKPGLIEKATFAFVIPTRASRFNEDYWGEVYDFFPALRHLSPFEAFSTLSSVPPFRIEMYGAPGEPSSGVLLFAPIFSDMLYDIKNKIVLKRKVKKKINESINFVHDKFGVEYVGLGATLPKLTNYGKNVSADVITTTGHAGTTLLVQKTVLDLIENYPGMNRSITIGFIGGGAIGLASMQSLTKLLPDAKFVTYDKRAKVNQRNKKILKKQGVDLRIASSNRELIEDSQLIVSAITSTLNIDGIDLSGKVIVDDSQPGSFKRDDIKKGGGELLWVVGHDRSKEQFVTRRQGYSFGPSGLHSKNDVWGCEAEVAAIAHANRPELAVNSAVTLQDIEKISGLFEELGVDVASYQSHGTLND